MIDSQIRQHLRVGNIVRIPINIGFGENKGRVSQTAYFRIIEHCGGDKFRGVCEDPYYGTEDWFLVNNGDKRVFSSRHVVEIPLTWDGNKNLKKVAIFRNKGYAITGAL